MTTTSDFGVPASFDQVVGHLQDNLDSATEPTYVKEVAADPDSTSSVVENTAMAGHYLQHLEAYFEHFCR